MKKLTILFALALFTFTGCNRCHSDAVAGNFSNLYRGSYLFKKTGTGLEVHLKIDKSSIPQEESDFLLSFENADLWKLQLNNSTTLKPGYAFIEASNTMSPELYIMLQFKDIKPNDLSVVDLEFSQRNQVFKISLTEDEKVCLEQIIK
jgi:hypothetical protein